MADSNIGFVLNLDNSEFLDAAGKALDSVTAIGEGDFSKLLSNLGGVAEVLGTAGAVAEAFKVALDAALDAEKVERTENSFEQLATQAGISGQALKQGLEQAAGGLIPTNDLLGIANKAIIAMGASASQLPQVLELARKASVATGESVETVFTGMTEAIESGNARMLKHYGIVVDQKQAYQAMATQLGVTTAELSKQGEAQAILNAVLTQGGKALAGVNGNMHGLTEANQQAKTSFTELGETVGAVIKDKFGGALKGSLDAATSLTTTIKNELGASFQTGGKQAEAQLNILKGQLADAQTALANFKKMGSGSLIDVQLTQAKISQLESSIAASESKIVAIKQDSAQKEKAAIDSISDEDKKALSQRLLNTDQLKKDQEKLNADLITLNKAAADDKIKTQAEILKAQQALDKVSLMNIQSVDAIEKEISNQKVMRAQANTQAIEKINNDFDSRRKAELAEISKIQASSAISESAKLQEIAAIKAKYANDDINRAKLVALTQQTYEQGEMQRARQDLQTRIQLDQQFLTNSTNTWQGFTRAAKMASDQATKDLTDVGKQGQFIFNGLDKAATSAFAQIGAAAMTGQSIASAAAQAMEQAFLKMIGDTATHYGEMLLLQSAWPPNPVGLAAGAALIAFGAGISALAGAGSSSSVSTGSGGGSSSSDPAAGANQYIDSQQQTQSQLTAQQQVQRTVNVNIAGNYLNSQESQRSIMEIMRNETDATGFTYNKIGV